MMHGVVRRAAGMALRTTRKSFSTTTAAAASAASDLRVRQIPIFDDNYCYLLVDEAAGAMAAVDPADADTVLAAVDAESSATGARLTHVLTTHHHADHSAGNEAFAARFGSDLSIVGPEAERDKIPALTHGVAHGDGVAFGDGHTLQVLGSGNAHTTGHVMFHAAPYLFCGDTVFVGGCGRFFEGGAGDMYAGLYDDVLSLPHDTVLCCGHEYTSQRSPK